MVFVFLFLLYKKWKALVHSFQSIEESTYHIEASNGAGNEYD